MKWSSLILLVFVWLLGCARELKVEVKIVTREAEELVCIWYAAAFPQVIYEPYLCCKQLDIVRCISENWLHTDNTGDHNFDGICNFKDYARLLDDWRERSKTNE